MKLYFKLLFFLAGSTLLMAQESVPASSHPILVSGPMLGYVEHREAMIWLQTRQSATVYIEYYDIDNPREKFKTSTDKANEHACNTSALILNQLSPGKKYRYDVYINNKKIDLPYPTEFRAQVDWKFRTPPPDFTAVFGSCNYINETSTDRPGKPYGGDYHIFKAIYSKKPDLMLWGGDNIYLRPGDWSSKTGYVHRYTHTRSAPEIQPLLAACPNLAIWDDHDFGPNDSNGSFIHKSAAHSVFRQFWINPPFINFPEGLSTTTHYEMNGIDFFFLDNRSFRTHYFENPDDRQMLGKNQIDWLIQNLKFSDAPFKMVLCGSQMISDAAIFENFAQFPKERAYLLQRIEEENIKGVIFLTGDRHHSEISKMINARGNAVYDITSSPLTSSTGETSRENEPNNNRVPGSFIQQRNFVLLSFTGATRDRQLKAAYYDSDGLLIREFIITQADMKGNN